MILSVAVIIVKKTFVSFKDIFILSNVMFYITLQNAWTLTSSDPKNIFFNLSHAH